MEKSFIAKVLQALCRCSVINVLNTQERVVPIPSRPKGNKRTFINQRLRGRRRMALEAWQHRLPSMSMSRGPIQVQCNASAAAVKLHTSASASAVVMLSGERFANRLAFRGLKETLNGQLIAILELYGMQTLSSSLQKVFTKRKNRAATGLRDRSQCAAAVQLNHHGGRGRTLETPA